MDLPSSYFPSCMKNNMAHPSSAIMQSIDNPSLIMINQSLSERNLGLNDLVSKIECSKLNVENRTIKERTTSISLENSYLLIDDKERLKFSSPEEFLKCLKCEENAKVKVVSIFGNTGDGKSHTMNECFFGGKEIFNTSNDQDSCTVGVWVAYDSNSNVICLDTEGLLGATNNENRRTRLLLKILAISDIVIYRTRSERLHRDLFTFLGTASRTYTHHFTSALQLVSQKAEFTGTLSALGPAVIIFHETRHTRVLKSSAPESAEDILRSKFAQMHLDIEAFSSLKYIGIQTINPPTSFKELRGAVMQELKNTTVRSSRSSRIVFLTLKALNDKFSGEIESTMHEIMFPDQYFTCSARCMSCESRCTASLGHTTEELPHQCDSKCKLEYQYKNWYFVCKRCYMNGRQEVVRLETASSTESSWYAYAKYAWAGSVIICPIHGEIYRDRKYWYGNPDPEKDAVRQEIYHVWPDKYNFNSIQNPGQRVIDGVSYLSEVFVNASAERSRAVSSWVADQIAPRYWEANADIKNCAVCKIKFNGDLSKHHCRACGKGVCKKCSARTRPVPERGWSYPVRVCDNCFNDPVVSEDRISNSSDVSSDEMENRARKVTEAVVSTISSVASVLEYPKNMIKDSARPSYWIPDDRIRCCKLCNVRFRNDDMTLTRRIHHCRDCGEGVCSSCSLNRCSVPHRGWDEPVRVCDKCVKSL